MMAGRYIDNNLCYSHFIPLYCEGNESQHSTREKTDNGNDYREDVLDQILRDVPTHPDMTERATRRTVVEVESLGTHAGGI